MKLVDIKGNITSKQRLLLMITFLVIIVVVFSFFKNINKKVEGIDYKKNGINNLLLYSKEVTDRDIYWNLDGIVSDFLNSYQSEYNKDIKSLNYYYKALDPNYKKYLGKSKYKELANGVITKVLGEEKDMLSALPQPVIIEVRALNDYNNAYMCKLATKNDEDAYIGIILDTEETRYNIFYIY